MEIQLGHEQYWTTFFEDIEDGFAGFSLYRKRFDHTVLIAKTIYWDALGRFHFGTLDGEDVPVEVVEAAIAEARAAIPTK